MPRRYVTETVGRQAISAIRSGNIVEPTIISMEPGVIITSREGTYGAGSPTIVCLHFTDSGHMPVASHAPSVQRDLPQHGFTGWLAPDRLLTASGRAWFGTALVGQLVFSLYLIILYGGATLSGQMDRWNRFMPRGYVPGDGIGNAALMAHVLLAVVIMLVGATQLMPALRKRVPGLHRWMGRAYIMSLVVTSIAGLYMVWFREGSESGDPFQHVAISLNAAILMTCGVRAWQTARARDFAAHRRWALRTYMAANGVFFFRLGVFLWLVINRGPVGFDPRTFRGPFLTVLAFSVYVFVPIAILERYLRAQRATTPRTKQLTAAGLGVTTLLTAGGIVAVSLILWIPAMR